MANVEKQRNRVIKLLKELFQLDQPDLDFGFYKIMHAKSDTVSNFLENDLLGIIQDAFGEADEAKVEEARLTYEAMKKDAEELGAPNPDEAPKVKTAKAAYDDAKDSGSNEGDVYEHVYRFFERYYDSGDFMSRRYFARETDGKAAPYSVPYDGREVYLHWANRDQYYIKTSEYLTNFTFDIAKHFNAHERATYNMPESLKMHCRIVEASEGDHNNVKAGENTERFFILHEDAPIIMEDDELVIQFEYRPDQSKTGQSGIWQRKLIGAAEEKILHALTGLSAASTYNEALRTQIGEDKNKRLLLRKYINQYTARNTMDYFIHKDLGGFLRRELDFYIKNEIMRLDDIESADAPRVESYLAKVKVLRKIAGELVSFLTQLEEFQKKIWLKKKFVTETNYCITLDRIPENFYGEIAANDAQHEEWVKLFAIDDLDDYVKPLTVDLLKANPFLVLDTAYFTEEFKNNLLADIQHLDEKTDGLLIHGENFQSLLSLEERHKKTLKCIYIDPPYNAQSSEILYKNSYKHSSWLSLMNDRIAVAKQLQKDNGVLAVAIDEIEQDVLGHILSQNYPYSEKSCIAVNHNPSGQQGDNFSFTHEYAYFIYPKPGRYIGEQLRENEKDWDERNFRDVTGDDSLRKAGPNCFYPIYIKDGDVVGFGDILPDNVHPEMNEVQEGGSIAIYPIDPEGVERKWRFARNTVESVKDELKVHYLKKRNIYDIKRLKKTFNFKSNWVDARYSANNHGTQLLNKIIPKAAASYPKSLYTVKDCLTASLNSDTSGYVLDYFAGSGTTAHAVIEMNREDLGTRKYIMVEMGEHFHTVMIPRIKKVSYSKDWKDGKPVSREGISHAFKYIRLESYEDALNNLAFQGNEKREQALAGNDDFRRDYMLKYWIDFETKDSPSLLNIDYFSDPSRYVLKIKKTGSDEYEEKNIDLVETFNWLIGLHVDHIDAWRSYGAAFKREEDPELPKDENTKLILDGTMKEDGNGEYHFRKIEGRVCTIPGEKNNMERVLIIWRKMTDDIEADNLILDEWFKKYRLSTQDSEFDVIYVNGSNNLPNLRQDGETWKVRLIEESFHQKMWDVEG